MASAFDQYGYVATLANTIPDLKRVLNQALAGKWSPDKFAKEIQDTNWWKNSADSVKQNAILKATKPGEFAQQRSQLTEKVRFMAGQMGVGLTEGHHGTLAALVDHAMALGWDDSMLQQQIGKYFQFRRGATAPGQAGALQQQIRQVRAQYGMGPNEDIVAGVVKGILRGTQTADGYRAQAAAAAKSKYPGFATEIDQGQTLQQIADPYVQTMAQTLELDPSSIDLYDPYIQRALTARDAKGQPTAQPLWSFQDALRQDSRYDHTTQAVNDAFSMVNQIGKDWGFQA
jgi:hypothetical protein